MSSVETDVYTKLYDSIDRRLARSGQGMPITRAAFLTVADMSPGVFDVSLVDHADDRTFIEAAYLCLVSEIPNAETMRYLEPFLNSLASFQFRKRLLRVLLNQCSEGKKGVVILNGEDYFEQ